MKDSSFNNCLKKSIAVFFGCGNFPVAQGSLTSLVTVILWLLLNKFFQFLGLKISLIIIIWTSLIFGFFIIGVKVAEFYSKQINNPDPKEVVIDEVVGQITVLLIAYCSIGLDYDDVFNRYISRDNLIYFYSMLSLILFRFFDIVKPFYIGFIDQNVKGGLGIMLDDLAAGFTAGLCICCFYIFALIL